MDWPSQSGGLNLIENFWDALKKAWLNGLTLPSTGQDLSEKLTLDGNKTFDIAEERVQPKDVVHTLPGWQAVYPHVLLCGSSS